MWTGFIYLIFTIIDGRRDPAPGKRRNKFKFLCMMRKQMCIVNVYLNAMTPGLSLFTFNFLIGIQYYLFVSSHLIHSLHFSVLSRLLGVWLLWIATLYFLYLSIWLDFANNILKYKLEVIVEQEIRMVICPIGVVMFYGYTTY